MKTRSSHLRFLVHVSMHDKRCRDAAVLFVDIDAQRGRAVKPSKTPFETRAISRRQEEPWLADVYNNLIFCDYKHREKRRVALVGAAFECGGRDPRGTQEHASARRRENSTGRCPRRPERGKRKLADDMRKKMLRRAGKLPKVVEPARGGRGSLSVEGRRRAGGYKIRSSLRGRRIKHEATNNRFVQFGPYPDGRPRRLLGARPCEDANCGG